jgi:hypothetical protein
MIPKQVLSFMQKLLSATENNSVKWVEGDYQGFYCSHKDYSLYIAHRLDPEVGTSTFHFQISANGAVTEFSVNEFEGEHSFMRDLYQSINANATNIADRLKGFFD